MNIEIDARTFQQLLTSLINLIYLSSSTLTIDEIIEASVSKFYSHLEDSQIGKNEVTFYIKLIKKAAFENWTLEKLKEVLVDNSFPEQHSEIFSAIWERDSEKIQLILLSRSTFNNNYENLSWRVDQKVMSNETNDLNEPVAFFDMKFSNGTAKFDMNLTEVDQMINNLNQIHEAIQQIMEK